MSKRKATAAIVVCNDNLRHMAALADQSCDLIYIDPPFGTQKKRRLTESAAAYDDRWDGGLKSFLAFMHPRLAECHRLLSERGTLYVHLDWRASHYVKIQLDTIFGARNFLNEIIWHYRTGGSSTRWFGRKHDAILVYAKKIGSHTFNVLREGIFRTDGLKYDADGRPYKTTRKGPLYFNAAGPALTDVWDIPFLSTVSNERVDWPTQKPLALLERIIKCSSNPGDTVADFFCGSGTTLVAAKRLGRRAIGCDVEKRAVGITRERLKAEPAGEM